MRLAPLPLFTYTIHMKHEFTASVDEHGVITGKLIGMITPENRDDFKTWLEHMSALVREEHQKQNKKVNTLIDLTKLEGYNDPNALALLTNTVIDDNPYTHKTATFGATGLIKLAQDTVQSFSGRIHLKGFETENEARAWLQEQE